MFSPEFQILLLSLRLDDRPDVVREANKIIECNQIDWDDLYSLADYHAVKPQLAKLSGEISSSLVPGSFKEKINDTYHQNLVDQLRYTDEFFRIKYMLEKAGIQIIPFKGFWLAQDAYGNLADREGLDVDVFVRLSDLGRIKELMEAAGYNVEAAFKPFTIEEVAKMSQEYNFDRIVDGISTFHIEFHWGICPPQYGLNISLEELQPQTLTGNISDRELMLFTPSAHLLLVILHHGGKDRFTQLKQVLDVARLIGRHDDIDWEWVISTARRFQAEKIIYTGIKLASILTGINIPAVVGVQAGTHEISNLAMNRIWLMKKPPDYWYSFPFNFSNWLFRLRSRTGPGMKIKITAATIRWILFRPRIAVN
jgi:hypothetical protein